VGCGYTAIVTGHNLMCGRVSLHNSSAIRTLMDKLALPAFPELAPRYNIPPGTYLHVVTSQTSLTAMQWGIAFGDFSHPNTKIDTALRKPALTRMLANQRCLLPINRFYEWPDAKVRPKYQGVKTRFCIHTAQDVMFLGGIYRDHPEHGLQFNVLTTGPTAAINEFHHRSPVIVAPEDTHIWISDGDVATVAHLLAPYPGPLVIYECDGYVDNARHEGPLCMSAKT
jgi:putative SOS response-associated peptidase YedK